MEYIQADLYDALAIPSWVIHEKALVRHLVPLADANGVAVDLGSGTGLSAGAVARTLPKMEVLACEPNFGLRAALMARVIATEGAAERVTVFPYDAAALLDKIAEPITSFTAFNMLGHLSEGERARLWVWLKNHLTPNGIGLVGPLAETNPDDTGDPTDDTTAEPDAPTESVYARNTVGRLTYEGAAAYTPPSEGSAEAHWDLIWRVYDGDTLIEERKRPSSWAYMTQDTLTAELIAAGFIAAPTDDDFVIIRQPQ